MPDPKIPPQNLEAERSLLGALMLDKDAIVKVADKLNADDFYDHRHGLIYESMTELYAQHSPIDILTLTNRLQNKGQLDTLGGSAYLSELVNTVPSIGNLEHYAGIVREKATLRRLITAASHIENLGYQEDQETGILLNSAEQEIFGVSEKFLKKKFIPLREILSEAFERIDDLHKRSGTLRGVATGFSDLDNLLSGLQRSDLIIIAARPSFGKTSLALDICRHVAVSEHHPVAIFSLEMSKEQLCDRMLCAQSGVDLWKMRTGKLGNREEDDDFPRIGQAMGILSEAPIWIDDSGTANAMEIRTKARRLHAEHELGLIMVDYLQLLQGRTHENRVQEVSEISRELKGIARELNVPVLALSQLSRAVESRPDQIPRLADLRESGSIEQDADVVMFIHREDRVKPETERKNIADIMIAKHRNGPVGQIELFFKEQEASFKNLDRKRA